MNLVFSCANYDGQVGALYAVGTFIHVCVGCQCKIALSGARLSYEEKRYHKVFLSCWFLLFVLFLIQFLFVFPGKI